MENATAMAMDSTCDTRRPLGKKIRLPMGMPSLNIHRLSVRSPST